MTAPKELMPFIRDKNLKTPCPGKDIVSRFEGCIIIERHRGCVGHDVMPGGLCIVTRIAIPRDTAVAWRGRQRELIDMLFKQKRNGGA